jgi:hypothetical protein
MFTFWVCDLHANAERPERDIAVTYVADAIKELNENIPRAALRLCSFIMCDVR